MKYENKIKQLINKLNYKKQTNELVQCLINFCIKNGYINECLFIYKKIGFKKKNIVIKNVMDFLIKNNKNEQIIKIYDEFILSKNNDINILYIKSCINLNDNNRINKFVNENIDFLKNNNELTQILIPYYKSINDLNKLELLAKNK